ncbi:MAG: GAF domain-containing protein [Chloroflexi bacterium]|nr:GAF domain-containing protein [Chloroflexota bacterium]
MPKEKILLLEDHAELRAETTRILADAGYRVQSAATGADALVLARREAFDLLIADIFLPDQSGIQVFEQARGLLPDLAGIVITGHSTWELALDALRAGFVGFLVKPVVPEQLLAAIVNALEQEKLRRENARLRALVPLYELSRAFMGTLDLKDVLDLVVATIKRETKAETVSLMLLDEDRRELHIAAAAGLPPDIVGTERSALGNSIAARVAQSGEPMMIAEGLPLEPDIRKMMAKPHILSALSLPMLARGQVIGVLNLSRNHGNDPFTHGDLELATVFVSQAAIAIEQARWFNQLKRLNDLSQRLARAVDLDETVATLLSAPVDLLNARGAALWLADEMLGAGLKTLGLDVSQVPTDLYEQVVEGFHCEAQTGWFVIPLRHGERNLGALIAWLQSPEAPSAERLGLLRTLAHTAGAAIESHRLRAREKMAYRELDRAVRADSNLKETLDRLLNEMMDACDAERGAIFLRNPDEARIEPWVARGAETDPDFANAVVGEGLARVLTDPTQQQALIGVPMMTGARAEGAIVLARSSVTGGFHSEHVDLLSYLASATALIVRNAQLYARSEEASITEERTRIAREIHDGVAQDLAFLVMKTGVAERLLSQGKDKELKGELREVSNQLRRDLRDVRRIIFALRPLDIEAIGFLPAIQKFAKEFGAANEIDVQLETEGTWTGLSPKLETALFRLTQETLNNIRKHARAKHAWVTLALRDGIAALTVRDDGRGFDLAQATKAARARGSVGLVQMRERAERAGGTFALETAPGKGTLIHIELPAREN